MNHILKSQ